MLLLEAHSLGSTPPSLEEPEKGKAGEEPLAWVAQPEHKPRPEDTSKALLPNPAICPKGLAEEKAKFSTEH